MFYYGWKPYLSVAARRKKAEGIAARMKKKGQSLSPVSAERGAIAKTFWGKSWCENLERYSDFENRLPRGRTYLRNGSVIDLNIGAGEITAQVMGSDLYQIRVNIATVPKRQWQAIGADCAGSIDSLVELLQGRLSKSVMERICRPGTGLFPAPREITFDCSCLDWAGMCKHIAAVFYGVGVRLDEKPELLFTLRKVDAKGLVARADAGLALPKPARGSGKVIDDAKVAGIFGIEMAEVATAAAPIRSVADVRKPRAKKKLAARKKKTVTVKKKPKKKSPETARISKN